MKIYAVSGLGADKRVFQRLRINGELIPIDWLIPLKKETLKKYSLRLAKAINSEEEFGILGVSFGGLVAVEISKILEPNFTILISSAEVKGDLRAIYHFIGKTKIINALPKNAFDIPRRLACLLFGTKEKKLLSAILDDTNLNFIKWALQTLLSWDNTSPIKNVLKINGTSDKMIPFPKDSGAKAIKDGGHFMIIDRAKEISQIINDFIK